MLRRRIILSGISGFGARHHRICGGESGGIAGRCVGNLQRGYWSATIKRIDVAHRNDVYAPFTCFVFSTLAERFDDDDYR